MDENVVDKEVTDDTSTNSEMIIMGEMKVLTPKMLDDTKKKMEAYRKEHRTQGRNRRKAKSAKGKKRREGHAQRMTQGWA